MRRMLNTLFITTQGTYLKKEGESIVAVIKKEKEKKMKIPLLNISGLVCFGRVVCSPMLLGMCAERGVAVSFLSMQGRFLARVQGPVSGNVLMRKEQYRRSDSMEASAEIASSLVMGKIANARTSLQRVLREHPEIAGAGRLREVVEGLSRYLYMVKEERELDVLRGHEGAAAREYFRVFDDLIVAQKEGFVFGGRSRRPPLDRVNALLSFIYTLLLHDVSSALETVGLDPQVGFLHRDRPGRPGLALDMMEEFRPYLADRLVLSLINLKQVQAGGFKVRESGGVVMDDDTRKIVLGAYQKRKQEEVMHPFTKEVIPLGMAFLAQALLFGRYLRGDLDGYPPYIWR